MLHTIVLYDLGAFPDWITALAAIAGLFGIYYAYQEYKYRTIPYLFSDVQLVEVDPSIWQFSLVMHNGGEYPLYSKIDKALLKVGDELFPTILDQEICMLPNKEGIFTFTASAPVGYVNETGLKRIINKEYESNTIELSLEFSSRLIVKKTYKYKTFLKLEAVVNDSSKLELRLLDQRFEYIKFLTRLREKIGKYIPKA